MKQKLGRTYPDIEPCPFCGAGADVFMDFAEETPYVRCSSNKCRASAGRILHGSMADAVVLWNKRATPNMRNNT